MKTITVFLLIGCLSWGWVVSVSAEERMRVTFINPGSSDPANPTGGFWLSVSAFMQAAADDLNIDLEIIYAGRNHIQMKKQSQEVARRANPPDYLIVVNEKLAAGPMIEAAERAGLNTFMINNVFVGKQAEQFGRPREKFPHWIGSLIPDNRYAGYQIAKKIIDRALEAGVQAQDGKLHLIAIAGDDVTQASLERVEGLEKAIAEYPAVDLKQTVSAQWNRDTAYSQTQGLLRRYPEIGAIWGANDPIAIGALEGAVTAGRQPGKDIFIGGLNWDAPGLARTKQGLLVTTVGGHFMTGGWALVMLYDYHHGRDFSEEGVQLRRQIFSALDRGNIDRFLETFGDRNWRKIDFTRFSKVLHPEIQKYDFSLDAILKQDLS